MLPAAKQYDQITLVGNPSNHGHLILRDGRGRETKQGESVWVSDRLLLKRGDLALVDYRHAPAHEEDHLITTGAPGGQVSFQKALPEKSTTP